MENINQIIRCLDDFCAMAVSVDTTWKTVLGEQMCQQLDSEGVFDAAVDAVVQGSRAAADTLAAQCGLARESAQTAEEVDLRQYHIQEFFEGQVYDEEGNVVDIQAAYCDCYKMHKTLSRLLLEGADGAFVGAQDIVTYFQAGADGWAEPITALVTDMVQPVLESVSAMSELLVSIGKWHVTEADNYINSFLTE